MRIVYLDAVFLKNAALDYCVLLVTAALAGVTVRRRRLALGAALGGAYAALAALVGGLWLAPGVAALAGLGISAAVFRGRTTRGRLLAVVAAVACGFAGACAFGLWLGCAAGLFVTRLWLRGALTHQIRAEIVPVCVQNGGKEARFLALVDTGNALRDPLTGAPVTVCDAACLADVPVGLCYALPIRTAAGEGTLRCFRPEALYIAGIRQKNGVLAISEGLIATGRGYSALTHADCA